MSALQKQRAALQKLAARFIPPGGFSLIEVVVAMSILSIGILAVLQMGLLATRTITSGNVVTLATLIAETEIEKIRVHRPITGLTQAFAADPDPRDPFQVAYRFSDPLAGGLDTPRLPNCATAAADGSGSCLAEVRVSWRRGGGGRGGSGEVRLQTMVFHGGA